ncbi:MAG: hypothetical protein RMI34_04980 [Chloroherpetonaceae bacterium]|nr:hypothetical protein [Chloroherpetonaceae bacterium]MCS7212342.1 hypothetical protein [Chloroherpetonaceae bacterium]MDW8019413.1 hypothetical protein [Chloroherpetonaceae bacterium]MDW8466735.1 hypothetical protein [Chloroherpetonaceae bacterium]
MQWQHAAVAVLFLLPLRLFAQENAWRDPCKDSLFLRLRQVPKAILTASERKYLEQKEKECAEFSASKARKEESVSGDSLTSQAAWMQQTKEQTSKQQPRVKSEEDAVPQTAKGEQEKIVSGESLPAVLAPPDSLRITTAELEPIFTPRNFGIFAAVVAALVGLAIALGQVTPSPF